MYIYSNITCDTETSHEWICKGVEGATLYEDSCGAVVLPECLLGVEATVEEERGGQLDAQHAQVLQFSLRGSNRIRLTFCV